ncbi:MAG: amidase [Pseudomonadota bacterium]
MMDPLLEMGALELSRAIENGETSCAAIMEHTLDRIDAVNPDVNAIISLRDREGLLDEARNADKSERRSALQGLPIAIKDLAETKGLRTTHGSPIFADHVPEADALAVKRLRDSGLIFIGKTNTPEFGLGSHSYNPVSGVTRNPYDLTKTAGGSSGGAAAALATRMLPVADGSDMMGSLRNPGAFCNVYGLRPTYGFIPNDPIGETYLHPLATLGPMARTIEDMALLLDVMAGPVAGDPFCLPAQPSFLEALARKPLRGKIGWLGDWQGYYPLEPEILELCEKAVGTFDDLGYPVQPIVPDFDPARLWMAWTRLRSYAVAGKMKPLYDNPDHRKLLKPEAIYEIEQGLGLSSAEVAEASLARSEWFSCLAEAFNDVDAIALPSAQVVPFVAEIDWPRQICERLMDTYHRWMEIVVLASLVGLPALNLPAGFTSSGLPMGFQLMGRRGSDANLLQLGQSYHEATLWPQKNPPAL